MDDFKEAIGRESFQGFKDKLIPYIAAFPTPQLFSADIRSINVLEAPFVGVLKVKPSNGIEECRKAWVELKTAIRGASMSVQFHNATGTGVGCDEDDFVGLIGWKSLEVRSSLTLSCNFRPEDEDDV